MKDEGAVAGRIAADLRMALRVVVLLAMASHAFPATATAQRVVVVYKEQQLLQVWNGGTLAAEFRICALSSIVGRKTRAGDRLVPEGIYRVTHMRRSASYKTIGIDYPNALEKAAGCTGSGIGIHGNCASSGCVGMRNDDMDALFAALRHDHPASVTVLLFYSRDHASVARLVSLFRSRNDERSALFLERLETVRLRWETHHRIPPWGWDDYGYLVKDEG